MTTPATPLGPALIAGWGSIGRRPFRNLKALGIESFAFLRSGRSTLEDAEIADYPSFDNLAAALATNPQLVVIANPSALHLPIALAAAQQGCPLYIEKPLSHALAGCDELEQAASARGLPVMIGCQFRFHPLLISLRDQLQAGRLGRVLGCRAEWGEYLPGWHPWEDHRQSYSARADLGGGVILTLIHPIDYLYWLFGPIDSVQATLGQVPELNTSAEDWAEITLGFASGVIGQVHLDYWQRPPVHRLHVWGTTGRCLWDFHAGTLEWTTADGQIEREQTPAGFDRNDLFLAAMQSFLDSVRDRRPASIPLADGIATLEVALAARQSHASGQRQFISQSSSVSHD